MIEIAGLTQRYGSNVADDGTYAKTSNLLDRDGKNRNGKEHYKDSQINDAALDNAIDHDMRLVFAYLA